MHWESYEILYGIFKAQSFTGIEEGAYNRNLKDMKKRYFVRDRKIKITRSKINENLKIKPYLFFIYM